MLWCPWLSAPPHRGTPFGKIQLLASRTALGRVGLAGDIGGAVAMLLQPENHWITSQRIEVSGGMML